MVFERIKKKWKVTVQAQGGPVKDVTVESYWSPEFEGVKDSIGICGAVQAWLASGKKIAFVPVSGGVELIG